MCTFLRTVECESFFSKLFHLVTLCLASSWQPRDERAGAAWLLDILSEASSGDPAVSWPHAVENQQRAGSWQPRHARGSSARHGGGHQEPDRKKPSAWKRFRETSRVDCWKLGGNLNILPFSLTRGERCPTSSFIGVCLNL